MSGNNTQVCRGSHGAKKQLFLARCLHLSSYTKQREGPKSKRSLIEKLTIQVNSDTRYSRRMARPEGGRKNGGSTPRRIVNSSDSRLALTSAPTTEIQARKFEMKREHPSVRSARPWKLVVWLLQLHRLTESATKSQNRTAHGQ
jgi:hypothetical protein